MTANLDRLSDALTQETPEQLVARKILAHKEEIEAAVSSGKEYVLDQDLGLIISRAG
jgi:hypothetical protein